MSVKPRILIGIAALFVLELGKQGLAANVPTPPGSGSVVIKAALVDQEMQARPVPLHGLLLATSAGDTITTRTDVNGEATASVPASICTVISVAPIRFQARTYRWRVPITVVAGQRTEVSLTNDNADIDDSQPAAKADESRGRLDPAAELFKNLGSGVCRVEAGLSHGTGFLADTLGGVILTNAHVVEGSEASNLSIVLDSRTRVRAQLLAHDPEADIAVLRIHSDYTQGRARIPLQHLDGRAPVVPGERLVALGFPLHQELTMTTGIASSVRAGAIISDVNINPGNSGGPLINVDGEAVAVNTFGDLSQRAGPGVSGSILVSRAGPALARASAEIERTPSASPDSLPVMPSDRFEIASLKAYADSVDIEKYRKLAVLEVGPFDLTIQTPAQTFVAMKTHERNVAKDRKKREAKAGLPESERYSEVREYRDWIEYVGDQTTPVVSFGVVPRVGETGGSVFKRLMLSQNLRATYRFQGDVRGVVVFKNGAPVDPIIGGHTPVKVLQEDRWVSLKDVADQGMYVFAPELLMPDSTGAPPSIVLAIRDLKSPKRLKCLELPAATVAQAWNDFESFYVEKRPQFGFRRADPKLVKKRKSAQSSGLLKDDCSWPVQSQY